MQKKYFRFQRARFRCFFSVRGSTNNYKVLNKKEKKRNAASEHVHLKLI